MNITELQSLINHLIKHNRYKIRKHVFEQMIKRNMNLDDAFNILHNITSILRVDHDNPDGITSFKIEGGDNNNRLAIKFTPSDNNAKWLIIITAMDKE